MSATFLDRVPAFKHNVTPELKRQILEFRAIQSVDRKADLKLPLPEKIEDREKVTVQFPHSKDVEGRIVEYALELDNYEVQSSVRAQDYVKTFMRANAILNGRKKVTESDLHLYDLIHPLFLNSMRELGPEKLILSVIRNKPQGTDQELIESSGVSRGTFYKYKKKLEQRGLI
jgi:hypothetical protein